MSSSLSTNDSFGRRGFRYQDIVAFHYLITQLKDIDYVNDEGHDDIDIGYTDGSVSYIQVKCAHNIFTFKGKSAIATAAISELLKRFYSSNNRDFKYFIFATNSDYPFGGNYSRMTLNKSLNYFLSISEFPNNLASSLKNRIHRVGKKEFNDKNLKIFESKFRLLKYYYYGSGKVEQSPMDNDLFKLLGHIISPSKIDIMYEPEVKRYWLDMLDAVSSDGISYKVDKNSFITYTSLGLITENNDLQEFFRIMKFSYKNEIKIEMSKDDIKNLLILSFFMCSRLVKLFKEFALDYDKEFKLTLVKFLKDKDQMNYVRHYLFGKNSNICILQYVIWELITGRFYIFKVEKLAGYKNGQVNK